HALQACPLVRSGRPPGRVYEAAVPPAEVRRAWPKGRRPEHRTLLTSGLDRLEAGYEGSVARNVRARLFDVAHLRAQRPCLWRYVLRWQDLPGKSSFVQRCPHDKRVRLRPSRDRPGGLVSRQRRRGGRGLLLLRLPDPDPRQRRVLLQARGSLPAPDVVWTGRRVVRFGTG